MAKSKQDKFNKLADKGKVLKIVPFIKHQDPELREQAVRALGRVGTDESMNALIGALHDRVLPVRMAVLESLVAIKKPMAAEHIKHAYGATSEPEFVEACKNALSVFAEMKNSR
ncbi:MAG: HEAT repeat domain-containing protein [Christensenellales bacterium]|jgi:HEAT repeat protein